MTDLEFETLGNNIVKWKYEYYKLGNPSISDEAYDYNEYLYCKEATSRGIVENMLGKTEDGKFYVYVGYKE
jgi:NAD-dependent DNA ligase